ncbi:MFS transporter [Ferrimonas lipolytica]|uniref:MFS transporter n=1 Tax=Ferrimonas lipolytica TaxID=2724191 RepID=A0A6H1UHQ2_9GAMM|nr:MFS transporter [Ferrimonas lipolytica]QIZ78159.1 MFS transporter [Ferrimonas lipolytica]
MKRFSTLQLIAFSLINMPLSMLMSPTASILPNYYLEYTAVTAAALASVTLIARMFDALTDPLIGYLSDRSGKRKPWMLLGVLLLMASTYPLYQPPAHADITYLLGWYMLVTLGWTLIEIPHSTLTASLSDDYQERNRVVLWRQLLGFGGGVLFMAMPLLLLGKNDFSPDVFHAIALFILISLPLTLLVMWRTVPEFEPQQQRPRFADLWRLWGQLPILRYFIVTQVLFGLAIGGISGMFVIYARYYLQLGDKIVQVAMPMTLMMVLSIPGWAQLLKRVEKHRAWAASALLLIALLLWIATIAPGDSALMQMQIAMGGVGLCVGLVAIVLPSMMADIVDYDRWRNRRDRAATLFSIQAFAVKLNQGFGSALALGIAAFFGFSGKGELSESASVGLKLGFIVWPSLLLLPMLWLVWHYRLGKTSQRALQRRLASRIASVADK